VQKFQQLWESIQIVEFSTTFSTLFSVCVCIISKRHFQTQHYEITQTVCSQQDGKWIQIAQTVIQCSLLLACPVDEWGWWTSDMCVCFSDWLTSLAARSKWSELRRSNIHYTYKMQQLKALNLTEEEEEEEGWHQEFVQVEWPFHHQLLLMCKLIQQEKQNIFSGNKVNEVNYNQSL